MHYLQPMFLSTANLRDKNKMANVSRYIQSKSIMLIDYPTLRLGLGDSFYSCPPWKCYKSTEQWQPESVQYKLFNILVISSSWCYDKMFIFPLTSTFIFGRSSCSGKRISISIHSANNRGNLLDNQLLSSTSVKTNQRTISKN